MQCLNDGLRSNDESFKLVKRGSEKLHRKCNEVFPLRIDVIIFD